MKNSHENTKSQIEYPREPSHAANCPQRLTVENFGPIKRADVTFGDLTVFVGPQATGKSILLQLYKLLVDRGAIQSRLTHFGIDWRGKSDAFLEAYFGEGMGDLAGSGTKVTWDGHPQTIAGLASRRGKLGEEESVFFIPAQRVMAFHATNGWLRGWSDFRDGDPFVVRDFGAKLHSLAQSEFDKPGVVFPQTRRFKTAIRNQLIDTIFGGFELRLEQKGGLQRRLVLGRKEGQALPLTVWSAGQREFVPLLLGAYHLLPRAGVGRRDPLKCAVLEELEMGLHPRGISAVFLLILDLLSRGYRVCLSTHSPHILDILWALRAFRQHGGTERDVLDLFALPSNPETKKLCAAALDPKKLTKVYYFDRTSGSTRDISSLDPGSEEDAINGWGGLSEFSGRANDAVASLVANSKA
jgi:hypothetical protein